MKTETNPLSGLDPLVSITELAEYLGVPVKTIYEWRQSGPRRKSPWEWWGLREQRRGVST